MMQHFSIFYSVRPFDYYIISYRQQIAELQDTILLKEHIIKDQMETIITLKKENERNAGHINRLRNEIGIKSMEMERYKRDSEAHSQSLQKAQHEAARLAEEFGQAATKTSESIARVKRMSFELENHKAQKQTLLQDIAVGVPNKVFVFIYLWIA